MKRYHHLGIPTDEPRPDEVYLERFKMYVSGYEDSPYGIEWMRFDPDCPLPDLVKRIAHVAFEVDDLAAEIEGKEILIEPNSPSEGVTVAFIVENGAPVELLEVSENQKRSREGSADVDRSHGSRAERILGIAHRAGSSGMQRSQLIVGLLLIATSVATFLFVEGNSYTVGATAFGILGLLLVGISRKRERKD